MNVNIYNNHWLFLVCVTWRKRKENVRLLRQEICIFANLSLFLFYDATSSTSSHRGNVFTSKNIFDPQTLSNVQRYFNAWSNKAQRENRFHKLSFPPKRNIWKNPHKAQRISLITWLLFHLTNFYSSLLSYDYVYDIL